MLEFVIVKRRLVQLAFVLIVLALIGGAAALYVVDQPYKGYSGEEVFVEIPPGSGVGAIGRRLIEAGVLRNDATFRLAMRLYGQGRTLKAGEYRFTDAQPPSAIIDRIARGDVFLRPMTFPEGLTLREMAAVFEQRGFGAARAFLDAARDASAVREVDPRADDLEGYLFPETYALPRSVKAGDLVRQMATRFVSIYSADLRQEAEKRGMTTRQVVTLASLIEKETARGDERPLVSAVYHNRLRIGMGLQCDPTVIFALQRAGKYDGNLTREDLRFDSPYNTYRYAGLPPGPIAAPGRASIEAALRPANVEYLYFVSRNDGSHVFASSLAEHNRNVQEFQVKYFRERRLSRQANGTSRQRGE